MRFLSTSLFSTVFFSVINETESELPIEINWSYSGGRYVVVSKGQWERENTILWRHRHTTNVGKTPLTSISTCQLWGAKTAEIVERMCPARERYNFRYRGHLTQKKVLIKWRLHKLETGWAASFFKFRWHKVWTIHSGCQGRTGYSGVWEFPDGPVRQWAGGPVELANSRADFSSQSGPGLKSQKA